ncbi:MAG TPA: RNA 2',3'-cyclic phosphodiesterase [Planctomycetaceae bacterium]|nr:RNA 2',3'-cyclic phosphodiesterase [Planctomycetaceae bacterium]
MTAPLPSLRLFFALKIPATPDLTAVIEPLRRWPVAIRAVAVDQLHLTVRFLGDTDPDCAPLLCAAAERVAAQTSPLTLTLMGVGSFAVRGRMSVVWIGIDDNAALQQLHNRLKTEAVTLGFLSDQRAFRPHLTIGRVKAVPPPQLTRWLEANRAISCGTVDIAALELIRSELTPRGPVYETVSEWALTEG